MFENTAFWLAALQIIWINVLLSGDNAVVIALACRSLPPKQRLWGMISGAGVAVVLRILFTLVVTQLMGLPFLKLVGGVLLLWIAIKLIVPEEAHGDGKIQAADNLWRAIRIVAIADIVMSLDNVIAIAASAESAAARVDPAQAESVKFVLIAFGLATSIPLIIAGSALLMAVLERFPVLVWAGAALLGWVAGEIMVKDPAIAGWIGAAAVDKYHYWASAAGALFVVGLGWLILRRRTPRGATPDIVHPTAAEAAGLRATKDTDAAITQATKS